MKATEENIKIVLEFVRHCIKELKITTDVDLNLMSENDSKVPSAGGFDPNNLTIKVAIKNRAIADILRTIAHELTHQKQKEQIDFFPDTDEELQKFEDEANVMSGRLVRFWGRTHREIYSDLL